MNKLNVTTVRQNLYKLVKETNDYHEPVYITSKNGNAVLISEDDWKSIQETLYLHSIPGLVKDIKAGLNESTDDMPNASDLEW